MAKKTVKAIKVMLNEKKSDPIMMDKEDLRVDIEGTELETTTMEMETNLKNLKNDKESNNEPENKQAGTLSLHIAGMRSSIRLKKSPKSMSNDFLR